MLHGTLNLLEHDHLYCNFVYIRGHHAFTLAPPKQITGLIISRIMLVTTALPPLLQYRELFDLQLKCQAAMEATRTNIQLSVLV